MSSACLFPASEAYGSRPVAPADYRLPDHFPAIHTAKRIVLDLETYDPDLLRLGPGTRRDGYIVGVGIKTDGFAAYYPLRHRGGPNVDEANFWAWFRTEMHAFRGEIVGANSNLYDADYLQVNGVRPTGVKWHDVQWAEALLDTDEAPPNYQLNTLARKWLGESKVRDELKALYGPDFITRMHEVHPGHAQTYVMGDLDLPDRILDLQMVELKSQGLLKLFELECRLTPFLLYLRECGVKVDLAGAERFNEVLDQKVRAACSGMHEMVGFDVNFDAPDSMAMAFDKLGLTYPLTAKGRPSFKQEWMNVHNNPFTKLLNQARKFDKAKGTFVEGYILGNHINGRIHCEFHPLRRADEEGERGTGYGRFSSTHPNLQNIPVRDDEIGPMLRALFIPEDGWNWFSQDYSQIEYRMLVHYACLSNCKGADVAQRMYQEHPDTDFHAMVSELTGLQRKLAKNLNFGLVYGMGKSKLARSLGLVNEKGSPTEKALEIFETYHRQAPFIKEIFSKSSDAAQKRGYVKTILGRRARFNLWEPKWVNYEKRQPGLCQTNAVDAYGFDIQRSMTHKALNRILQGSAADLMKKAMVDIWESGIIGQDLHVHLTVHDELDGSVAPTKLGEESLTELKRLMDVAIPLKVPVLTSGSVGANWAEAH